MREGGILSGDPMVVSFESSVAVPAQARAAVSHLIDGVPPARRSDVLLLVSELVSNSVIHGHPPEAANIEVTVTSQPGRVRVEVSDLGPGIDPGVSEFSTGWGLRLVELLSDRWGIGSPPGGRVWFEVDTATVAAVGDLDEAELFAALPDRAARDALFERYSGIARHLARRFVGRGEGVEDLEQVASIGLIKAMERFDTDHGATFSTFASATILGELKRHLRDRVWSVRVPRGLKEASLEVSRASSELGQQLGRTPNLADLAKATDMSEEDVIEALQAGEAFGAVSLDAPTGSDEEHPRLLDLLGGEDERLALAERWQVVAPALHALPERERRILYLRFYRGLTQSEIADLVGISQMHVSRLLAKSLDGLRRAVEQ
ncbi:MAG: SigB/SigF/SigG family RNA polymerase sigma factor [Acidimicrobiia bacterium]